MSIVLYIFSALFVALSFFMLFAYYRTQHAGLLLMSCVYGVAGLAAGYFALWWPLAVGFVLVWAVRFMGLDPDAPRNSSGGDGKPSDPG